MLLRKHKIRIKRITDSIDDDAPQYSLSYRSSPSNVNRISHEIISAFVRNNDLIIGINSEMNGVGMGESNPVNEFLHKIKDYGLFYKIRRVQPEMHTTFFGFPVNSKKKREANEVLTYIPNSIWKHPDFSDCLPLNGANYYVIDESDNASNYLEEVGAMNTFDKANIFEAIIFDVAIWGQMGITSKHLSVKKIKEMLNVAEGDA